MTGRLRAARDAVSGGFELHPGEAGRTARRPVGVRAAVLSVVAVVVATGAQLVRTDLRTWHAWWAEDGGVFYPDAVRYSFGRTLTLVYNGYLQTVSRPVAELATWSSTRHALVVCVVATDLVVAVLGLYVWWASRDTFRSSWAPIVIGASLVVIPQAGTETLGSVSDLHWYLDFACFWALWRPLRNGRQTATSAVVAFLAIVSDPLAALMLLPGAVSFAASPSDRRRRGVVVASMVVGGLVQIVANRGSHPYRAPLDALATLRFYVVRVIEAVVIGERPVASVYDHTGIALAAAITLIVVGLGAAALWRMGLPAAVGPVVCVVGSGAYALVCLRYRGGISVPRGTFNYDGSRYTLVPALLLWVAVAMVLDHLTAPRRRDATGRPLVRVVLVGAAIVTAGSVAVSWRTPNVRAGAPAWSSQLAEARRSCALPAAERPAAFPVTIHDSNAPDPQPGPDDVSFHIAPIIGTFHPFVLVVPCRLAAP